MKRVLAMLIVLALVLGGAVTSLAEEPDKAPVKPPEKEVKKAPEKPGQPPKKEVKEDQVIEVVFVLDTTGSMSGLIQAAKDKIWAIANTLASAESAPEIRLGLVGYRDRGDVYITKLVDITNDLDKVYKDLMGFRASGGGDTPESVNQALHEAVTKLNWSSDDKTYKVIFLVGDCPPHMDYKQDVKYPEVCKMALEKGIVVNTVQCGTHGSTTPIWQDIARKGEGQYFRVDQSGSAIRTSTPFDEELAKLSGDLEKTRIYYGRKSDREARRKISAGAEPPGVPAATAAARGVFKASDSAKKARLSKDKTGAKELVDEAEDGKVEVDKIKEEELPENMKKMTGEERKAFVAEQKKKREEITVRIRELDKKRQAHIKEELKKSKSGKGSLDEGIYKCIKEQAAKKDIIYKKGPKY